ncbi:flagellar hook protein FlgE [Brevundimonas intermedia]|uniref:Flagellar hook protein FlgE n=1 Tax=Brevundimonas intermedia TaxID=74315 RepID=A0ABQ5TBF9_9CAUL|nr:flagellar hook-basal body complex protein [Brevundimonas intermedia]GLK50155.1 flagellar hook protein FlgE [Brevundimonas intermedia]
MLGSIYIGLSGMNAYSRGLQTISNNVANLNSPGFKASSVTFSDVFNVGGLGSAYSGHGSRAGGQGVRFGSPTIDFTQGDLRQSGGDLDLAVQGGGFLVLKDGEKTVYARTGQFAADDDGFITLLGTRYRLGVLNADRQAVPLNVDASRTSAPKATTAISLSGNISSTATDASVSDIAVYDSRGARQVWQVRLTAAGAASPNQWTVAVTDQTGATVGSSTLRFVGSVVDPSTSRLTVSTSPQGADPLSVVLDFSAGVTSFSSGTTSTLRAASVDGYGAGTLTRVGVNDAGRVELTYSNGRTEDLGAVALADFRNPQQLERIGNGLFRNLGPEGRLLESGVEGMGALASKQLEASNVDLSQQFGDLILIQRGFQASSQVVSVTNDMIQQLFGMRGQG